MFADLEHHQIPRLLPARVEQPMVVASTNSTVIEYFQRLLQLNLLMGINKVIGVDHEVTARGMRHEPQLSSAGGIAAAKVDRVVAGAWDPQREKRVHDLPADAWVYSTDVLSRNPNTQLPLYKNSPKTRASVLSRFGEKPFAFPWHIGISQAEVTKEKVRQRTEASLILSAVFDDPIQPEEIEGNHYNPHIPHGIDFIGVALERREKARRRLDPPQFNLRQELLGKNGKVKDITDLALDIPIEFAAMLVWKLMDGEVIHALSPAVAKGSRGMLSPQAIRRATATAKLLFPEFAPDFLPNYPKRPSATIPS